MSFETPKRRIAKLEQLSSPVFIPPDQSVLGESALVPTAALENAPDSDVLKRLRTLFELLDSWDQKEKSR